MESFGKELSTIKEFYNNIVSITSRTLFEAIFNYVKDYGMPLIPDAEITIYNNEDYHFNIMMIYIEDDELICQDDELFEYRVNKLPLSALITIATAIDNGIF